ncbi:MAG: ComEA family DNA-binding protein [Acidimicrobiales bacterium]
MAEPIRPSPDDDDAVPTDLSTPPGFEHLGWSPSWRDRLESVLDGAPPGRLAAVGAAVVVALVVGFAVLRGPAPPLPELTLPVAGGAGDPGASTTTTTSQPAEVVVHAAGAVDRPGVYRLAAGSRVADLLDAAGGPAPDADLDRLNLAALLQDGDRVFVPVVGQDVPTVVAGGTETGVGAEGAAAPIDLNSATLAELDTLPGIGPTTAQAILDERERRGGFRTVEDLLDVRGIGEAKLAAIRDLVRV